MTWWEAIPPRNQTGVHAALDFSLALLWLPQRCSEFWYQTTYTQCSCYFCFSTRTSTANTHNPEDDAMTHTNGQNTSWLHQEPASHCGAFSHNTRALSHLDDDANTVKKAHLRWLVASLTYTRVRFSFENAACKRQTDRIAEDLISTAPMYGTLSIPRAFRRGSDSKGNRSRHRLVQETKDLRASLFHVPSRCLSAQW